MEEKRRQIIARVHQLYMRFGIKSVTMDDAAAHLGISKKTLYDHFTGKEDLVSEVLQCSFNEKTALFDGIRRKNLNAIEELFEMSKIIREIYREYNPSVDFDIRKYYPSLSIRFRELKRKRMLSFSRHNLNKGKKEGLYRFDLNVSVLARLHVFRVGYILDSELFTVKEMTSGNVFHELLVYHLNGIISEEGRRYIRSKHRNFSFTDT